MPTLRVGAGALALALVTTLALAGCSSSSGDGTAEAPPRSDPSTTTTEPATTDATTTTTEPAEPIELPDDRPAPVHVPPGYDESTPAPLVVLLHGYGVSGEGQTAYLRMTDAVDAAGMLLVAPDGTENQIGKRFWNATDACCGPQSDVDDSAYLADVIAKAKQDYNVDPDRVFIVGHSNGGFMAFRMACDHADEVAAIVSLEGATWNDPDDCSPSEPVSTLQVHGTADRTIGYDGGKIGRRVFPSAPDTLAAWVAANGCDPEPDDPAPADRQIVEDLAPATVTAHTGCDGGTTSELWTQPDGTHIPPFTEDFSDQLLDWLQDHAKR